ncbi:MAG TPA: terminase family protein [Rubrobacter sp.]|nr:terminase family protein [Rubrobacter sp.]
MSFVSVDALERELRGLESEHRIVETGISIPPYPVEFAMSVGIEPDPWQVEVLASEHQRKILCCGRQTGKSTVGAVLAVHKALTCAGSTVLVVAPGERQAKLLFSKAASLYRQAGYPLPAHSERRTGLELSNGSIIEALPAVERTTRGYSVDLLVVDEAAAVPDQDYHGILPALIATRGEQVLLSTPRGKRGFFWEIWQNESVTVTGSSDWQRVMVHSDEVDRIRPEDLKIFRSTMPEQFFEQEFYCEFLDTEGGLFSYDDIEAALAAGDDVQAFQIGDDEW